MDEGIQKGESQVKDHAIINKVGGRHKKPEMRRLQLIINLYLSWILGQTF